MAGSHDHLEKHRVHHARGNRSKPSERQLSLAERQLSDQVTAAAVRETTPLDHISVVNVPQIRQAHNTDGRWHILTQPPSGWDRGELMPGGPHAKTCIASLLHGDEPEYFAYACVLGRRLQKAAGMHAPDRVLMCAPGSVCDTRQKRRALQEAGWAHLMPVRPMSAEHLDKSRSKRHALVFTKLRGLELPYNRVLLLDLDLLPRDGVDMADLLEVQAPAAKYHCAAYRGPAPEHAQLIPPCMMESYHWSPNAGVMRLDPLLDLNARIEQVKNMEADIARSWRQTYLPEQYFLVDRLSGWRHVSMPWNWEVCPQFDDPGITHPLWRAQEYSRQYHPNDAGLHGDSDHGFVKVWHYSGTRETAPWLWIGSSMDDMQQAVIDCFRARDPRRLVVRALCEWRLAFDELLTERCKGSDFENNDLAPLLSEVKNAMTAKARHQWGSWWCDCCGNCQPTVQKITDVPADCEVWRGVHWACADCIVAKVWAANRVHCVCVGCQTC